MTGVKHGVRVYAPAKVNLILRVLDRRHDGYHNLWSLMQTVGVEDELHLRLRSDIADVRLECDDPSLPMDGRNLVARAASLVLDRARLAVGLQIRLVKRIPVSAGLGGGSSDAAATIIGLNHLLGLEWSIADMVDAGRVLGSDVPFFFFAPTAIVRGRGEEVAPLRLAGDRWIVLVNPGFPIETRWAYDRLAAGRSMVQPLPDPMKTLSAQRRASWDDVIPLMQNDFEAALAFTHPTLKQAREELLARGAQAALLSGSGATVFGIFPDEASALNARDAIGRTRTWWVSTAPAGTGALLCQESGSSNPLHVG